MDDHSRDPPDDSHRRSYRKVSDERLLEVLRTKSDPVATAGNVADELDMSRRNVLRRLDELEESDPAVHSKRTGPKHRVFWYEGGEPHRQYR